ncbi:MAG: hypothetical protein LC634_06020 [Sphingomonadales bacterium]|nr:hypothetical protein [Sphingomonadales bacterium]
MVQFTADQWLVIALIALIALLIGMIIAANPKWKRRYREERARYEALERDHEARVAAANARIAELESDRSTTGAAIPDATRGTDELSAIAGIDRDREIALNEAGYHRFKQLAKLSTKDRATIEGRLGLEPGHIDREKWPEQAALLAKGDVEAHRAEYVGREG